ncbi:biotin--[acetyl-CoA-carboxylase] ligase [Pistricoccus aurantiacus]|uniref:biotin--[acetyl-CoA-carboxylase] ligase n=1 Tax=Pistricoccus aurantiacus TaxID=1883414 RepID=UPI003631D461
MAFGNLIRLLSDGDLHSDEHLGKRLNMSPAAVWRQLQKLEALGVPLETVQGSGYRLKKPLELLHGPDILSGLSCNARCQLERLFVEETLPSTNRYLHERFAQGAGHAEACLAEQQTAGQGRRGRAWLCPWGQGLLLSLGWKFEGSANTLEGLSLAIGVGVAEVLEHQGVLVALKWPNDILLCNQMNCAKLGGILLEIRGNLAGPCNVVIGLGLNVSLPSSVRQQLDQPVAALHDQAPLVSRNRLAADLLEKLLGLLKSFEVRGFEPWQEAWNTRNVYAGCEIVVFQGKERYIARAGGVDKAGNLEVWREGKIHRLTGGEISVRGYP